MDKEKFKNVQAIRRAHQKLCGEFVVDCCAIEHTVISIISVSISPENEKGKEILSEILINKLPFSVLIQRMWSVLKGYYPNIHKEYLQPLHGNLEAIVEHRNSLVHSIPRVIDKMSDEVLVLMSPKGGEVEISYEDHKKRRSMCTDAHIDLLEINKAIR